MRSPALDFALRVAAAFVATLVLAPFVALVLPDVRVHRLLTRVFLVAVVVAFAVRRGSPRTWPAKLAAMGLRGPDRWRRFLGGAALSIGLVVLLLCVSWALGGRDSARPHPDHVAVHFLKACLSAVVVAFLEEILFRGYMLEAIGGFFSAALYAVVHYFKPLAGSAPPDPGFDPLLGVRGLGMLFESFSHPRFMTLGVLSLFLLGLALNRLRRRTGTLYLGIGIHAGLVFILTFYRRFLDPLTPGSDWIHGGGRLHDGVLGTVALALLLVAAHWAPLPKRLRGAEGGQ